MKVAVIGSRKLDLNIGLHIPENTTLIITGGAKGIDSLAENYAKNHNIPTIILKPEYDKYGRLAPLIRNKKIVARADLIIAFWNGKSKGTEYTLKYANGCGKRVILHKVLQPV